MPFYWHFIVVEKLFDSDSESSEEEEEPKINYEEVKEERDNVRGYVADKVFAQIVGDKVQYRYKVFILCMEWLIRWERNYGNMYMIINC